jgi:hypothetical protein
MIASVSGQGIHTPVQAVTIYNASKGTTIRLIYARCFLMNNIMQLRRFKAYANFI